MPRERLRGACRRGGSRGRGRARASSPQSSASSEEILSPHARTGRGRGRGRGRSAVCPFGGHPSARFMFPCILDNAVYFVTVRIEKCEHQDRPGAPADPRPPSPVPGQQLQSQEAAGEVARNQAGPSEPERNTAPYTDTSASDSYGCPVVEEPHGTFIPPMVEEPPNPRT